MNQRICIITQLTLRIAILNSENHYKALLGLVPSVTVVTVLALNIHSKPKKIQESLMLMLKRHQRCM